MSRERVILEIDGKIVKSAVNEREVEIELNFDLDDPDAEGTVSVNKWDFEGVTGDTGAFLINQQFEGGLTGGIGCGEGIPFKYSIQDDNGKLAVLDAYLDLGDPEALFECGRVKLPSKIRGGIDWLNDIADSVEYSILYSNGIIQDSDFIKIPYIISSIPNSQDIAMLTISAFILSIEITRSVKDSGYLAPELINPFETLAAIAKLVIFIVYLSILLIALFKLISDLLDAIIQPTKYHSCMKLITLLEKGAQQLGMTFYSTIFENDTRWKDVVLLPAKYRAFRDPKDKRFFGAFKPENTGLGYFEDSFGTLLRNLKVMFNAKIAVKDNVISLERIDFNPSTANFKLPPVEQKIFGHNFGEWKSVSKLEFVTDPSETNTIDSYEGTLTVITPRPVTFKNIDMILYGGTVRRNDIAFSRGVRKEELTGPEAFFNTILQAFSFAVNALERVLPSGAGGTPSGGAANTFGNRIGMLALSNDTFTNNKLILYKFGNKPVDNKVSNNNAFAINTSFLYDNFHAINSGVPTADNPNGNQWKRYTARIGFCKEDYELVKDNNLIFDVNGNVAKIESLKWNVYSKIADITFRVNEFFLKTTEIKDTPNGEQ